MDRKYGGIIWTNHVLVRLKERNISQSDVFYSFQHPDTSRYAKTQKAYIYQKYFDSYLIEVVARKNEKNEWIILSAWKKNVVRKKNKKTAENIFVSLFKKFLSSF